MPIFLKSGYNEQILSILSCLLHLTTWLSFQATESRTDLVDGPEAKREQLFETPALKTAKFLLVSYLICKEANFNLIRQDGQIRCGLIKPDFVFEPTRQIILTRLINQAAGSLQTYSKCQQLIRESRRQFHQRLLARFAHANYMLLHFYFTNIYAEAYSIGDN